jgi:hypothetical protein
MRNFLMSAALLAMLAAPSLARADEASDRTAAIGLCRAEVIAQAGADADAVRFDQVRVRGHSIRVDIDLWRNGHLQNVRCDVAREGGEVRVAAITPTLQTASAER